MQYYSKIEAYFERKLSDVEHLIFEQELVENPMLKQEFEAYETTMNLLGFAADILSEEEMLQSEAEQTTASLINFTAEHLDESTILAISTEETQPVAKVQKLKPTFNRTYWTVAASLVFLLGFVGIQFYLQEELPILQNGVVETTPNPVIIKKEHEIIPSTVEITPKETIASQTAITSPAPKEQKYEPANLTVRKQEIVATRSPQTGMPELPKPLAINTIATSMTTATTIEKDKKVTYEVEKSITFKAGFHVKSGASFTAKPIAKNIVNTDKVIESNQPIELQAEKIVLKPGFHAKAGTSFAAKTTPSYPEMISNSTIDANESVVLSSKNTITLKPGFHAKAGASFVATVH